MKLAAAVLLLLTAILIVAFIHAVLHELLHELQGAREDTP